MFKTLKVKVPDPRIKCAAIFLASAAPFIILCFLALSNLNAIGAIPVEGEPLTDVSLKADAHPMSFVRKYDNQLEKPPITRVGYDPSVLRALREMGLSPADIDIWIEEHPDSALVHLRYLPEVMQQHVASTALFIKKSNAKIDDKTAWREAAALVHYSAKYGVPHVLTTAVAKVESTFNPDALSPKGASGVMQVMWKTHRGLLTSNGIQATPGKNPLADPERSIAAGTLLLSRYLRTYGSVQAAMEKYLGTNSTAYKRKVNQGIASIVTHHVQNTE